MRVYGCNKFINVHMQLPTLLIVDYDTNAVLTSWGRSAVTKNKDNCINEWKNGRAGVSWMQLFRFW